MRRNILSATAICVLFGVGTWAQTKNSQVGTWNLDIGTSAFGSESVPKSITVWILKDTPQLLSWRSARGPRGPQSVRVFLERS